MDRYFHSHNRETLNAVILAAANLHYDWRVLGVFEQVAVDNLEHRVDEPSTGNDSISLLLYLESDFELLIRKLDALRSIYNELCDLFNVSTREFPLRISKVESGSLWIKLFGESRVVSSMISLVEASAQYLYRNFTREGKLTAIPKSVEAITSILDLERRLNESGIQTDNLKEHINKSSVLIGKQLTELLEGEAHIEINEQHYSVGKELEQAYLNQSRRLLLETSNDSNRLTE